MPVSAETVPRILLVDDDPGLRLALEFCFDTEGLSVRSFESGEALLREKIFPKQGCVILDWRLPGMNGLQTLSELRRRDIQLPAILITSNPGQDLRAAAAAAGIPLIEKPLLTNELLDHIGHLLTPSEEECNETTATHGAGTPV